MSDKMDILSGALAATICPGCREFDESKAKRNETGIIISRPCRHFRLENFYYDHNVKHYHCRLWEDRQGRLYPEKPLA